MLRERLWRIRAKQVVLATGALERPLVFANNDRPGIMLASVLRTYLHRYGVVAGKRTVVITNNCSAYQTALDLHDANVEVAAIIDTRQGPAGPLQEAIEARGIAQYRGYSIKRVKGGRAVKAVQLAEHLGKGQLGMLAQPLPVICWPCLAAGPPPFICIPKPGGSFATT